MNRSALLEYRDVAVAFGSYVAVEGVSLRVAEGEFLSLVGPTGCGKSTLLNAAAGLLSPSEGEVWVAGRPLKGLNPLAGYLFQQNAILPWKTALDNVALPLVFRGTPWKEARERARAWLERNPDTAQRLVNAMVRGLRWMQGKSPEEIAAVLPEEYFLGDRALYLKVLRNSLESFSPTGRFSDTAPLRPLTVLSAFDPNVARARIDLKRTYTNEFVDRVPKW